MNLQTLIVVQGRKTVGYDDTETRQSKASKKGSKTP